MAKKDDVKQIANTVANSDVSSGVCSVNIDRELARKIKESRGHKRLSDAGADVGAICSDVLGLEEIKKRELARAKNTPKKGD